MVTTNLFSQDAKQKYMKELVKGIEKKVDDFEGYQVYQVKKRGSKSIGPGKYLKVKPHILITEDGTKLWRSVFEYTNTGSWIFAESFIFICGGEKFTLEDSDPSRNTLSNGIKERLDVLMTEEQFKAISYSPSVKVRIKGERVKDLEFNESQIVAFRTIYDYNKYFMK